MMAPVVPAWAPGRIGGIVEGVTDQDQFDLVAAVGADPVTLLARRGAR